jgi:hypothetical protein
MHNNHLHQPLPALPSCDQLSLNRWSRLINMNAVASAPFTAASVKADNDASTAFSHGSLECHLCAPAGATHGYSHSMLRTMYVDSLESQEQLVQRLLASPMFHRGVRAIHRTVDELRHGRDPNDPIRQGEATQEPSKPGFIKYFIAELRDQVRGTESKDVPPPPPTAPRKPKP